MLGQRVPPSIGRRPDSRTPLRIGRRGRSCCSPPAGRRAGARLWASHCNKIEVGCCTGCALAVTTAGSSSAILEREHTNAKEPIVNELAEIEVETEESEEDAR